MTNWDTLGKNLIFVFSLPRSGSTMLEMMIESHSKVCGSAEPHVMVPLRYVGYYGHARQADYDIINSSLGLREFVERLSNREEDYLDACRAYAGTLYCKAMTQKSESLYFVDKTPPNVLEWQFITRVFPSASYVVLTRHPVAIFHSFVDTFFMGNYALAQREENVLQSYLPAVAEFLREATTKKISLAYESLVQDPENQMRRLLKWLGLEYEPSVVAYGRNERTFTSVGDMMGVHHYDRPVRTLANRWISALKTDEHRLNVARDVVSQLKEEDLITYGYQKNHLFDGLDTERSSCAATGNPGRWFSWYLAKRRMYFILRSLVHRTFLGVFLKKIRYFSDVLLRE